MALHQGQHACRRLFFYHPDLARCALPSASEFHRIGENGTAFLLLRGLYRRWGISPRPEEAIIWFPSGIVTRRTGKVNISAKFS